MEEVSYRPLIETMTWSYSRLETFDCCPYRWFLTYIHLPKPIKENKFYASFGLFMHELLEGYYKNENTKEELLIKYLTQFMEKTKGAGRPSPETVQKYFDSGARFLRGLKPMKFKMVSVEEKIDFSIGNINFTGRIDYIGECDGEYVIVDNKSRDLKPRSKRIKPTKKDEELDSMLRQLYIYAAAVRRKYGKFPKLLCFNCFKTGMFIEEPFKKKEYDKAILWVRNKVEEIANAHEFHPNLDYFACKYLCGVGNDCCYNQGGI